MPSSQLRENLIRSAKSVVIKIGTAVLTKPDGTLDRPLIRRLANQIAALRNAGRLVTVVSSGAIGAGMGVMEIKNRPRTLPHKQAAAAIGQRALMRFYEDAFKRHDLHAAQILLTRDDFENRTRYLNIRNTITTLHKLSVVPVINENDTVAVDEIEFGDNDILAALTANLIRADLLLLLTVVDGLLDDRKKPIDLVEEVSDKIIGLAEKKGSGVFCAKHPSGPMGKRLPTPFSTRLGSGGMKSKLQAVRTVTEAGELAVIANGRAPRILERIFAGQKIGTVFVPAATKLSSRRRWIGWTVRPAGKIHVDRGAARALLEGGKSLLAIGIAQITGTFQVGDVVEILDHKATPIARGLVSFSSADLRKIKGLRTSQFKKALAHQPPNDEVIHRNQLVLIKNRPR